MPLQNPPLKQQLTQAKIFRSLDHINNKIRLIKKISYLKNKDFFFIYDLFFFILRNHSKTTASVIWI
ncbi:hypothetical protein BTN99_09255 [Vibrio campbellii]|nr:hypothetical protein BTN99_09255 [Vibrio campbellii]